MKTQHNHAVVFGRLVSGCTRCEELKAGAPARQWTNQGRRYSDSLRARDVRNHDCKTSRCGPICTYGDY